MEKIKGIYTITNKETKEVYVGSSQHIIGRWYKHKSLLKHERHENPKLQNSVTKYGIDKFSFEIVEDLSLLSFKDFKNIRNDKEQHWVNALNPVFNLQIKIDYSEISEETRKKISDTLKRKHADGTLEKTNTKKLYQYDRFDGSLVKEWDVVNDAIRAFGLTDFTTSKIHRCCWGETPSFAGYFWTYEKVDLQYARAPKSRNTIVLIDEIDNTYSFFSSLSECEEALGFGQRSLSKCVKTNKLYRKRFRFIIENAPVIYDLKPFELLGTRKVVRTTTDSES